MKYYKYDNVYDPELKKWKKKYMGTATEKQYLRHLKKVNKPTKKDMFIKNYNKSLK